MLQLILNEPEKFDEINEEFIPGKSMKIHLEHSLVSLKKWEAKYHKPFLTEESKSIEETIDYIKFMTITQNVPNEMYLFLTDENICEINKYMEDPMTATWFSQNDEKGRINGEQVTAELIYYWMISFNIPVEFQKWHLNQLLTLIKVCNVKNQPQKKMSKRDTMNQYAALNAARKKQFHTKG